MPRMNEPHSQTNFARGAVLLSLEKIHFARGGKIILQDINLSVCAGEIVTLIGPNGAGKSSVVKIALNLCTPNRGLVQRCAGLRIGYVPQKMELEQTLPLTVQRFLKLTPRHPPASLELELEHALAQAGAHPLRDAALHALSGGEMRRVLLARALLHHPDLLIMDEPSAGMDINGQAELYRLLQTIREQRRCGILLVSHDLYMVMATTDRVFCLNRHLCCSGPPQDVRQHPEFVALFGQRTAAELAIYHHHHDHEHGLHGDIQPSPPGNPPHEAEPRGV